MSDPTDDRPPVALSDQDAAFAIMRLLQRRPWGSQVRRTMDTVVHQVVAEAFAAALKEDGVTLTRPARTHIAPSPWPAGKQGDVPEHPAD